MNFIRYIAPAYIRKTALLFAFLPVFIVKSEVTTSDMDKVPHQEVVGGVAMFTLGFDKLSSFPYKIIDAGTGASSAEIEAAMKVDQVPKWIHFYDNKQVVLTGYLMPLQLENGKAKKFVMMRDINTCCYGAVPNMNDYVVVTMKGEGVQNLQDVPVKLTGTFRIEPKYEGGYIVSLFVMDGEKFLGARK